MPIPIRSPGRRRSLAVEADAEPAAIGPQPKPPRPPASSRLRCQAAAAAHRRRRAPGASLRDPRRRRPSPIMRSLVADGNALNASILMPDDDVATDESRRGRACERSMAPARRCGGRRGSSSGPLVPATRRPPSRFIAGEPMKPATKRLAGSSIERCAAFRSAAARRGPSPPRGRPSSSPRPGHG